MKISKKIIVLLLAAVMLFALAACSGTNGGDDPDTNTPVSGSTPTANAGGNDDDGPDEDEWKSITIGSMGAKFIGHFDPTSGLSTDVSTSGANLLFDEVFFVNPNTGTWDSNILESWEFREDNVVALTVKDGVTFANGEQMLAEDLLFSYTRAALPTRSAATYAALIDFDASYISDDGMTLYYQFKTPYGPYQQQCQVHVVDKSWIEANGGDDFDYFDPSLVNGSGPYKVTEFTVDTSATYQLRDDWWMKDSAEDGYCEFDELVCYSYSDETTLLVDFENGVVDIAMSISDTSVKLVENNSLGTVHKVSSNAVCAIVMDVDGNSLFDNMALRQAICYGTDTEALAELGYGSLKKTPVSSLSEDNIYCVPGHTYEYNPDYAKSKMEESGLSNVSFTFVGNSAASPAAVAEGFQYYMNSLGISIDLQLYDPATCIAIWQEEGGTDFTIDQNSNANTAREAAVQYDRLNSTTNFTCISRSGEEINALLQQGKYNSDSSIRAEAYAAIQEYLYNNYEYIPITEWMVALAYGEKVAGTQIQDVYTPNLRYIAAK